MKTATIGAALLVAAGGLFVAQAQLAITEVMVEGNLSCLTPDFWELTNFGTNDIYLDRYSFSDHGQLNYLAKNPFANLTIRARSSVIFLASQAKWSVRTPEEFKQWWGPERLPPDLQILTFESPRFDGPNGDELWLYDPASNVVDMVQFGGSSLSGQTLTYDPDTGLFGDISFPDVNSAWQAATCPTNPTSPERDAGSPGFTTGPVPLSIMVQPISQTVDAGVDVAFCVLAGGLPRPRFQWQLYGTNLPTVPANVAAACLTISNVQPEQAGPYQVIVSNGVVQLLSETAWLTVNTNASPPCIMQPPADIEEFCGQTAFFAVAARGFPPPRYQWQSNGVDILGETNRTLAVYDAALGMSGTVYRVQAKNSQGATNACATLRVTRKPRLAITEIMAWPSNEASRLHQDWFELTNFDTNAVNLQGYRFADRATFLRAVTITNSLDLPPGESVIFVNNLTANEFARWWGPKILWPGVRLYTYSGFDLDSSGEAPRVWNAAATDPSDSVASATYEGSPEGVSLEFEDYCYTDCPGEGCITGYQSSSVEGVNGAVRAVEGGDIGSPGYTTNSLPLLGLSRDDAGVRVRCRLVKGQKYRLEYKNDLSAATWTALLSAVATNSIITLRDLTGGAERSRFYRLVEEVP